MTVGKRSPRFPRQSTSSCGQTGALGKLGEQEQQFFNNNEPQMLNGIVLYEPGEEAFRPALNGEQLLLASDDLMFQTRCSSHSRHRPPSPRRR